MGCDGGNMKIALIGDEDSIALMRMAGVKECYSEKERFDEIVKRNDIDILLITTDYAKELRDKIFYHRLMKDMPIIVEIPGKVEEEWEDTIKKLIVRAVGVEVE